MSMRPATTRSRYCCYYSALDTTVAILSIENVYGGFSLILADECMFHVTVHMPRLLKLAGTIITKLSHVTELQLVYTTASTCRLHDMLSLVKRTQRAYNGRTIHPKKSS